MQQSGLRVRYQGFQRSWRTLRIYERFEQAVALLLACLIAVIIVLALWELAREVVLLAVQNRLDPLDHRVFQAIFGQIMTVLIALEFKHSIIRVVATGESLIQVRTVLLIALLALARKLIILDLNQYSAGTIFALAAVLLALGVTYWLVRDQDTWQDVREPQDEDVE
ncbi:MAG TPA: phosphate-starvation-inducible PsiE family protein [Thermoanaerobaculia bacterium]|nr:phosphate-starvation-inducible PsiE family protein [Thermoanaerobaculia bacterium]